MKRYKKTKRMKKNTSSTYKNLNDSPKEFKITFVDGRVMWIISTEQSINMDARHLELVLNKEIKEAVSYESN